MITEEKEITHSCLIFVGVPKVIWLSLSAALAIMGLYSSRQGLCLTSSPQDENPDKPELPKSLTWDPSHPPHVLLELYFSTNPAPALSYCLRHFLGWFLSCDCSRMTMWGNPAVFTHLCCSSRQ